MLGQDGRPNCSVESSRLHQLVHPHMLYIVHVPPESEDVFRADLEEVKTVRKLDASKQLAICIEHRPTTLEAVAGGNCQPARQEEKPLQILA